MFARILLFFFVTGHFSVFRKFKTFVGNFQKYFLPHFPQILIFSSSSFDFVFPSPVQFALPLTRNSISNFAFCFDPAQQTKNS
jgi:hypothetical protein